MKKLGKRPVVEFFLKLINFLMILFGASIVVLGAIYLIKWKRSSGETGSGIYQFDKVPGAVLPVNPNQLRSVWFFYLLFAIGATLFLISCLGYLGTRARNPCCLSSYSILLLVLVLSELVGAAFVLCRKTLNEGLFIIDKHGKFGPIYPFIQENWKIVRWVILVALVLEVVALVLTLYLWTKNRAVYDSSDNEENNVYSAPKRRSINKI